MQIGLKLDFKLSLDLPLLSKKRFVIDQGLVFSITLGSTNSLPTSFSLIALKLMANDFKYNFSQVRLTGCGAYDLILQCMLPYLIFIETQ